MRLVNTTGRLIIVSDEDGMPKDIIKPDDGVRARVEGQSETVEENASPVYRIKDAAVVGLPAPEEDTYYIVTSDVAHLTARDDVVIPEFHEGALIDGRYVGVRRFLAINRTAVPKPPGREEQAA